jgi:hypothetical protein
MNKKITILFCLITVVVFGQKTDIISLGKTTIEELKLSSYSKDPSAAAVILEEQGNVKSIINGPHDFVKNYYVRIKIFNNSALGLATIKIPYYKMDQVKNIKAITYNLVDGKMQKKVLTEKEIFKEDFSKDVRVRSFAIPNVKEGSVIEYRYTLKTNARWTYDWDFQSEFPKVKSIYKADLPVRIQYNVRIIGGLVPQKKSTFVKKRCNSVYDCVSLDFEMYDIPAFIEEAFLSNKRNYLSRLSVQKDNAFMYRYKKETNWEFLDRRLKYYFEKSLDVSSFYERKLPQEIINETDDLIKAKLVYNFIRSSFVKNNRARLDLKRAYNAGEASDDDINLSLYYALKAAGLNPKMLFLSSRSNGKVVKLYATVEGLNSGIVKIEIDGKSYHLDASNKLLPFGMVSFDYLNGEGRVFDYNNGSYWELVKPALKTVTKTKINLSFNEDEDLTAKINVSSRGYDAVNARFNVGSKNKEKIIEDFESIYPSIEVGEYANKNLRQVELPFNEKYDVTVENDEGLNEIIQLNPFVIGRLKSNPFKLSNRTYPVDFGYKRERSYYITLDIPKGYKVSSLPTNKSLRLPEKGGVLIFNVVQKNNQIVVYLKYSINKPVFLSDNYPYLKEFYNQIFKTKNSIIELKKL